MRRIAAILFLEATAVFAQQAPITKVQTALNHLTVIEMSEPVTMAAAGSDAFEIKRHGNRVFIEPVRPNASTNLFLWTAHGESVYELPPAGEVNAMNVLIAPKPQPQAASLSSNNLGDSEIQKIADLVMSKVLVQTEHISQHDTRPVKDRVSIRIEGIVRAKESIYVRYQVSNGSRTPYRILDPKVESIRPTQSPVSLPALVNSQLNDKTMRGLGLTQTSGVAVVRSEMDRKDVPAGGVGTGVVAIRITSVTPQLYRFVFGSAGSQPVVANAVL